MIFYYNMTNGNMFLENERYNKSVQVLLAIASISVLLAKNGRLSSVIINLMVVWF